MIYVIKKKKQKEFNEEENRDFLPGYSYVYLFYFLLLIIVIPIVIVL